MGALTGLVLVLAGGLLAAVAITRPISVGGTVNLGLMSDRVSLLLGAGACCIIGAMFVCTHAIVSAVHGLQETIRTFERYRYERE